jgi:Tfp pilus assembly PilM family ATPase
MKELSLIESAGYYIEIRQHSLKGLGGEAGLELPLERTPNGRLTPSCIERVRLSLQGFLKKKSWLPRVRVYCAIAARGVSLRRLSLPVSNRDNLQKLMRLQIESEFPLSPDELAWGFHPLDQPKDADGKQDYLVVAVKKETIEDYVNIFEACGAEPCFTLAALARSSLCPHPAGGFAVLDIGRHQSELIAFEQGVPTNVRIIPWGGENITGGAAEKLGVDREEAEKLKLKYLQDPTANGEVGQAIHHAVDSALDTLVRSINGQKAWQTIYLSGRSASYKELAPRLAKRFGSGFSCESLNVASGTGRSAAVLGLKKAVESRAEPIILQINQSGGPVEGSRRAPYKWAAIAILLALALLSLPYGEALLFKPHLARKLEALRSDKARLPIIDRELGFLQYVQQNQPPYLDALYLLAKSVAQGTRLDSVTMNRRGEVALRGSMRTADQVGEFRNKLIDSGFFANVTVEEQSPTPDRQKVNVRMTALWKPLTARNHLSIGPTAQEIEKAKNTPHDAPAGGAFPGMDSFMPPMPVADRPSRNPVGAAGRKVPGSGGSNVSVPGSPTAPGQTQPNLPAQPGPVMPLPIQNNNQP